ncbi:MAG: hypothetical protein JW895_02740 [Thermoleophilaceae bacterium]|nr:hypothetical protein [Thermoleophilaceae bacterium]
MRALPQLRPVRLDERARPGAAPSPRRLRELRWELARGRYRVEPRLVAEAVLSAPDPEARRD